MGMSQFVWGFKAGSLLASSSHVPLCVGFLGGKFCHCWLTTKVGHANCPLFVRDQSGTSKCPTSVAHFGPGVGEEEAGEGGHSTTVGIGGWYGMAWHGMLHRERLLFSSTMCGRVKLRVQVGNDSKVGNDLSFFTHFLSRP